LLKWIQKYRIVDVFIPLVAIIFTLLIEGKFDDIGSVKRHPIFLMSIMFVFSFILIVLKIYFEYSEENLKKKVSSLSVENDFFKELISSFKYQISQPLEDKLYEIYNELNFDNRYRITVYTYTKKQFFSIGRYSANTHYKEFGRISIKNENEVLFDAWHNGELNKKVNPNSERKMPSEKIAIKYLYEKNEHSPKKDKFGVVVFETTNSNTKKLNNGKLDSTVKNLNEFLNDNMGIRQDLNFAMQEDL